MIRELRKVEMSMAAGRGNAPAQRMILVRNDDSDREISPPAWFLPESRPRFNESIVREDPLELRLAPSDPRTQHVQQAEETTSRLPNPSTFFDLTNALSPRHCDESNKRRKRVISDDYLSSDSGLEVRLKCIICMETMKDDTSTICGHIFCKECILGAIRAQRSCPTCRKALTTKDVHRIYISGNISAR